MGKILFIRIGIFFALIAAILVLPWPFVLGALFLVMLAYAAIELTLVALLADLLFGVPRELFFDIPFVFTLLALFFLGVGVLFRRRVTVPFFSVLQTTPRSPRF